jgi:1-acyl-sn-glycerol-3-phosphate acyltransferase
MIFSTEKKGNINKLYYTIFDTPILNSIFQKLALSIFRIFGWKVEGQLPDIPKYVTITSHTSNWDLPVALLLTFAMKTKISIMAKDNLFRWPFGVLFKWLGCIPIDRKKSKNIVDQMIQVFRESKRLILVLAPEGTRKKVTYWKTGFYYIAKGANVPIVLGFIDYKRKVTGIGPVITPTGDIEADIERIQSFYASITGRFPEKAGKVDIELEK